MSRQGVREYCGPEGFFHPSCFRSQSKGHRVNRRFRLARSDDFKRVRRSGKSYAHPLVVLVVQANEVQQLRIGVLATRSVGGAVERNRARRLLRAAIQPLIARFSPGWDIVLIARQPLLSVTFLQIQTALETLIARARLFREEYVD